ncbi:MAG: hypothetical protein LBD59_03745 [Prevotellaceae bacterium]|jgi:hypothetical protein|nr:hypothetical protein [Prevotellaceae bacterium]
MNTKHQIINDKNRRMNEIKDLIVNEHLLKKRLVEVENSLISNINLKLYNYG